MAVLDPLRGEGGADAVDAEEELQRGVAVVEGGVVEAAEAVREGDFFDFGGEAGADVGDGEGGFFGGDFLALVFQGGDGFAVGEGSPVVLGAVVVVEHLLEDLDCSGVWVGRVVVAAAGGGVLGHAGEFGLP